MNYFLTGCDANTEWQLPWFTQNYANVCGDDLVIADFGMTPEGRQFAKENSNFIMDVENAGWFSKVQSMWKMKHTFQGNFCWIDTDCEIKTNPSRIFDFLEPNKLTVVVDHPWTQNGSPWTPQGIHGPWYNTGVVAFSGRPTILDHWYKEVRENKRNHRGDQEALYYLLNTDAMMRFIHIAEAPHRYNVLRLDIAQNRTPPNPAIVHWTGRKGKEEIKEQMRGN
jgi:hypothetical protein